MMDDFVTIAIYAGFVCNVVSFPDSYTSYNKQEKDCTGSGFGSAFGSVNGFGTYIARDIV